MSTIIKISEAAVIAIHAVGLIAKSEGTPCATRHIAGVLGVSYNHLTKVLQRLTRAGLLVPGRGPKGGFILSKKARTAKLRDVFEAIDGKMTLSTCLMKSKSCGKLGCILGNLLLETNNSFRAAMDKSVNELLK